MHGILRIKLDYRNKLTKQYGVNTKGMSSHLHSSVLWFSPGQREFYLVQTGHSMISSNSIVNFQKSRRESGRAK